MVTLLSIVIPTRDRPGQLPDALRSIASLDHDDLSIETIVVVDGSALSLDEIVAPFGARLLASHGSGISAARNTGFACARGEYVLFLDDDDALLPGFRDLLRLLQQRPGADAAYGQIQTADAALRPLYAPYPAVADTDPFQGFLGRFQQVGTVLCRRPAVEAAGLFDESLESAEDWDWLLRLARRQQLACVLTPTLLFRQRPPGRDDRMMLRRLRSMRRVFWHAVRDAGDRRPGWATILRCYVANRGRWTALFVESLKVHVRARDLPAARFALVAAARSSPYHLVRSLRSDRTARGAAWRALSSGASSRVDAG